MKTTKMNTFLMGLVLLSSATLANAQSGTQAPAAVRNATTATSTSRYVHDLVASLPGVQSVSVDGQEFLSFSGKNYKDEDLKTKEVSKEITVSRTSEI